MSLCFVLLSVLLPLSFSSRFFPLLLLSSLLSFSVFLRHSGTSPSMVRCLSRPPPFLFRSSVFLVPSPLLSLFFSCVLESHRPISWSCPCLLLHSCIFRCCGFLCDVVVFWLLIGSPSFFSSSHSLVTTAHSRCDEFFDCHFFCICSSTSASTSWYLIYFRFPLCIVFTTIWPLIENIFHCPVRSYWFEWDDVFHVDAVLGRIP